MNSGYERHAESEVANRTVVNTATKIDQERAPEHVHVRAHAHMHTCTYKSEKEIAREVDIGWRVREGPHRRLCCEHGSLCRDGSHSFIRSHHVLDPLRRELHQQRKNDGENTNRQSNPTWRGSCVTTPSLGFRV